VRYPTEWDRAIEATAAERKRKAEANRRHRLAVESWAQTVRQSDLRAAKESWAAEEPDWDTRMRRLDLGPEVAELDEQRVLTWFRARLMRETYDAEAAAGRAEPTYDGRSRLTYEEDAVLQAELAHRQACDAFEHAVLRGTQGRGPR
jgi:hypothetical protein